MLESFFTCLCSTTSQASHTSPTQWPTLKIFCSIFFEAKNSIFGWPEEKKKKTFSYLRTRHVCLRYCRNPSVHRHAPSRQPLLATRIEHCSSFMQSFPKSWAEKLKFKIFVWLLMYSWVKWDEYGKVLLN